MSCSLEFRVFDGEIDKVELCSQTAGLLSSDNDKKKKKNSNFFPTKYLLLTRHQRSDHVKGKTGRQKVVSMQKCLNQRKQTSSGGPDSSAEKRPHATWLGGNAGGFP